MDRAVLATATELLAARHYPGVIAVATDALDEHPENVPMLLVRARAHVALRRDLEAQADLRDIIRLEPRSSIAYRLLGELAARRDENESAAIFFEEALRLDPGDHEAEDWLSIVRATSRASRAPVRSFAVGSSPEIRPIRTPTPPPAPPPRPRHAGVFPAYAAPASPPAENVDGFGEYLVATGIVTRDRLRAAQMYQRSMNVRLGTAIVTLGLASPQRIEWAAVAYQAQLVGRGR